MNHDTTVDNATANLMDEELKQVTEKQLQLGRVAHEIEDIVLRENLTMQELAQVFDLFNARVHSVISKMKVKDIKETYERQ